MESQQIQVVDAPVIVAADPETAAAAAAELLLSI